MGGVRQHHLQPELTEGRRVMKKVWRKPEICEREVALEVTAYESSDIDIVI
jgi:coenzyme PQQ precursor peptide PqqA